MHPRTVRPNAPSSFPLVLSSLVLVALGLASTAQPRQALWPTEATGTPLERALATIREDALSADLHFFASDTLGGRDTPSNGQRVAARFLEARLERLGWKPGARDGYFHYYQLYRRSLESACAVALRDDARLELTQGTDYFFYARPLADHVLEGAVVFVGDGRPEDLENLDLEGKWALCTESDLSWRRRRRAMSETGAVGMIVVPAADDRDKDYSTSFSRMPTSGTTAGDSTSSFSSIYMQDAAFERLLALAGVASPAVGEDLGIRFVEQRTFTTEETLELENVCAFWPGSDPELSKEAIILSAHYDHIGIEDGKVYNGADDNGSGSIGMLALAEALAEYGPMRRSVMLIWVSGEEKGLLGSAAWTKDPWLPGDARPIANINMDMIGRNAPDELLFTPSAEHPAYNGLAQVIEANAPLEGFGRLGSADQYWTRSDHANFAENLEIPVAFLFSDVHEDYHRDTDTADKIDYDKMRRVVRLCLRMLVDLQGDDLQL